MSIEEIKAIPVQELAEDKCILFLWCTNSHLHEAFHVLEAWGFHYKTVMTWIKTTNGDGVYLGVGNWLRNNTEQILVAVKGRPIVNLTNQTTAFTSTAEKGNHSKKPDTLYQTVESLCPQTNRLDMFARVKRDGWDAYGLVQTELAAFGMTSLSARRW
jgi:site-specific DNA-methyltransferase (adenine-specific)